LSDSADLRGRTAIVTGGSRGLGRAIAEAFVIAGASVYINGREPSVVGAAASELRAHRRDSGQAVEGIPGDVSRAADCAALVKAALGSENGEGPLILVNNAGVYGPKGPIEDVDWGEWVRAVEINLFGTVLMIREVIPVMRERRYGKIINLSGGGATGPLPLISAYAASKAAVVRITETVAQEIQGEGIDVNAIAPGALNTRLLDEVLEAGPERVGEGFYERAVEQRATGGAPLDKGVSLATFLASAESDGISGRLLSAVWDDWAQLPEVVERLVDSDVFTLRRIVPADRDWPEPGSA
jgi:NAD(P)-dependent dehydrogenase (short-subunit alcohol dehydrogenase family)